MGIYKELSYSKISTKLLIEENEILNSNSNYLTFKSYVKKNCLYLLADNRKIEREDNINLSNILKDSLIFCFKREIKKPRIKLKNNKIELYSEKHNYTISLKSYFL